MKDSDATDKPGGHAEPVHLKQETLLAFAEHIRNAEAAMESSGGAFLWCARDAARFAQVRKGQTVAEPVSGEGHTYVPEGVIHDWLGATWAPSSNLEKALALLQDYDNHKSFYPEVMDSKLIRRSGNDFEVYMRLLKKKVIAVVLDTAHQIRYSPVDEKRWLCRSETTRISEVENAGKPHEKVHPPDTGYGFLWRLYSYWRLEEQDGGLCVECRAISLTRDIPKGLAWLVKPVIKDLPRDALLSTLDATRRALSPGR